MARLSDTATGLIWTVALYLLLSLFYLISVLLVAPNRIAKISSNFILLAAIGFRGAAWFVPPSLSDDVFRYRFEGQIQAHGLNPYQVRPASPEGRQFEDEAWPRMVAKDFKAGYGPLIERLEAWTWLAVSRFSSNPFQQARLFRIPSALFDLACMWLLWIIARERFIFYAWCPLTLIEFWSNGHNDAIAVFFLLLSIHLVKRPAAYLWLGFAVAAKWWPAAIGLALTGRDWRRMANWPLTAVPVLGFGWAYLSDVQENARFMTGFVGGWRNNDSLFGVLNALFPAQNEAKYVAFALFAVTALWIALRPWPVERRVMYTLVALLLISANLHVWYLTWLAALLPLVESRAVLAWVAGAPLFHAAMIEYHRTGVWNTHTPLRWLVYLPVFILLAWEVWISFRASGEQTPRHSL